MAVASLKSVMIHLADLIHPLSTDDFLRDYWYPQRVFVAHELTDRLQALVGIEEFQNVESLTAVTSDQVKLFGPDGFRSHVPASVAIDFYERGDTLYFTGLEQDVAATQPLRCRLAEDLGIPPDAVFFEAFAARAGAVSTLHYDWDVNFQVLLRGRKTWRVTDNCNVSNPLSSFIPGQRWGDEAAASDRYLPDAMPDDATTIETRAGSVLFLPRGTWHETTADEDCFGVNFVLRPMTWAAAFGRALTRRLEQDEMFRAFTFGGLGTGLLADAAATDFERMRAALVETASKLRLDETAWSNQNPQWKWRGDRPVRLSDQDDGTALLTVDGASETVGFELPAQSVSTIRSLLQLKHRFGLLEASVVADGMSCSEIVALLSNLAAAGFLDTGSDRVS